ncbi:Uncharacterised protein [Candidatus Norongarragalina meridionalis]|nr:Uncharacterised protein [Candidatus Norongarragalina meridionalis]
MVERRSENEKKYRKELASTIWKGRKEDRESPVQFAYASYNSKRDLVCYMHDFGNLLELARGIMRRQKGKPIRILDLGCGAGIAAIELRKLLHDEGINAEVEGLTLTNIPSQRYGNAKNHLDYLHIGTIDSLVKKNKQYDLILSRSGAAQYGEAELGTDSFYTKINKILKKKGHFLVCGGQAPVGGFGDWWIRKKRSIWPFGRKDEFVTKDLSKLIKKYPPEKKYKEQYKVSGG